MKIEKEFINATGLTTVYEADDKKGITVDFVFVHGLGGHPRETWEAWPGKSDHRPKGIFGGALSKNTAVASYNHNKDDQSVYWPLDFLPDDCPESRIFSWGYDSKVSKGWHPVAKHDIWTHAMSLLNALSGYRSLDRTEGRKLVFLAHSLGGIIVKHVLEASDISREEDVKDIVNSTIGVVFFATPHQGSYMANVADIIGRAASATLRFDSTNTLLDSLELRGKDGQPSRELTQANKIFRILWDDKKFTVRTFQESKALTGINVSIANEMVVSEHSSALGDVREHQQLLDGDHRTMCKFLKRAGNYDLVRVELVKLVTISKSYRREIEKKCFESLHHDGRVKCELGRRERQVETPLRETCEWVFESPEYKLWNSWRRLDPTKGRILWIEGIPGCGKSVLMKALIDRIREKHLLQDHLPVSASIHAKDIGDEIAVQSFFFHQRHAELATTTPSGLFRTIFSQLYWTDHELRRLLTEIFERFADDDGHLSWKDDDLESIFRKLYKGSNAKSAYLFVDAIDECDAKYRRDLVKFLEEIVANSRLRICLSSRHWPALGARPRHCIKIIVEDHNKDDIMHYVEGRLSPDCSRRKFFVSEISRRANGVFLWAELVLNALNNKIDNGANETEIEDTLHDIPDQLEKLYEKLIGMLINNKQYKSGQRKRREEAFSMVTWALLAAEPLTVRDLRCAIGFSQPFEYNSLISWKTSTNCVRDSKRYLKRIQDLSSGLIEVHSATTGRSLMPLSDIISALKCTLDTEDLSICATEIGINFTYPPSGQPREMVQEQDQRQKRVHSGSLLTTQERGIEATEEIEEVEEVEEIEGSLVQFIHETVRTFFLDGKGLSMLDPNSARIETIYYGKAQIEKLHWILAKHCLQFIGMTELATLDHGTFPPSLLPLVLSKKSARALHVLSEDEEMGARILSQQPFMQYAVRYVFDHFTKSGEDTEMVVKLFETHHHVLWRRWKYLSRPLSSPGTRGQTTREEDRGPRHTGQSSFAWVPSGVLWALEGRRVRHIGRRRSLSRAESLH